jgi:predicted nucleotidyltransferase
MIKTARNRPGTLAMPEPATSKADITQRLASALPELRQRYPIRSLALFGSFATNDNRPDSDIDLIIELDRPLGFAFFTLQDELTNLLGRDVDLVTASGLKPAMARSIREHAEPL